MARGFLISEGLHRDIKQTIARVDGMPYGTGATKIPTRFETIPGGGGGGISTIRLGQCEGPWPNEPPLNVRVVRLFKQPDNPTGPADWIPETDSFGDPVFAVTINWFTHIPVGQGDLLKWCAVVPISDLAGSYDTGQVTYEDQQEIPILRPYSKLWLLIAVEC
jgi:hypothetical protein